MKTKAKVSQVSIERVKANESTPPEVTWDAKVELLMCVRVVIPACRLGHFMTAETYALTWDE